MIINKDNLVFRKANHEDIPDPITSKIILIDELHEEENKDNFDQLKKEFAL